MPNQANQHLVNKSSAFLHQHTQCMWMILWSFQRQRLFLTLCKNTSLDRACLILRAVFLKDRYKIKMWLDFSFEILKKRTGFAFTNIASIEKLHIFRTPCCWIPPHLNITTSDTLHNSASSKSLFILINGTRRRKKRNLHIMLLFIGSTHHDNGKKNKRDSKQWWHWRKVTKMREICANLIPFYILRPQ